MAMEQHGAGLAVVSLQLGIRSKPVIPYQGRSVMISPVAIVGIHKVLKQGSEDVQHPDRGNDCCGPGSRVTALGALTTVATSAVEILQYLIKRQIPFCMMTNNSSLSRKDYQKKLDTLKLPVSPDQILTSGVATLRYLKNLNIENIFPCECRI